MADTATTVTQLNGWFKTKYGKFQDNIPEAAKLYGMLGDIVKAQKIGKNFNFPVELSLPQGTTYAAAGAGAFAFEETIPGEMKEATIDGSQIVVSDIIDYESAAKAVEEGPEAYGDAGERLIRRMKKAGYKRCELSLWYGQGNLGVISSMSASTVSTRTVVITTASWAGGIWTGMKNMRLQAYDPTLATLKGAGGGGYLRIDAIDIANRTLTISGRNSSGGTDDTQWTGGTAVANADVFVPFNSVGKDMAGVNKIVTNTGSLFGISATDYELWAGNTFSAGSVAFSLKKLQDAIADAVAKGLDEKATVFVSPRTWANLCSDQAALRKYDASYTESKSKNGFRSLEMYSQNGALEIMPYSLIKEGEAFILPVERFMKIGAQDLSPNVPGRGEQYFDNATNSSGQALAGYRLMMFAHFAVIAGAPGLCTKVTNIVNS
ncbi:MAG: hypothetical protein SFW67_28380 [Myxococcaceae bacterium]|nr:hypothetical protein [Myxococcaceae bacterium]